MYHNEDVSISIYISKIIDVWKDEEFIKMKILGYKNVIAITPSELRELVSYCLERGYLREKPNGKSKQR